MTTAVCEDDIEEPYPISDEDREQALINTKRWQRERAWLSTVLAPDECSAHQPANPGKIGRQRINVGVRVRSLIKEGLTIYELSRLVPCASRTVMTHLRSMPEWHLVPQVINGAVAQNAPWILRIKEQAVS